MGRCCVCFLASRKQHCVDIMIKNRLLSTNFLEKNKKKLKKIYGETTNVSFLLGLVPILWIFIFFFIPLFIVLKTSFSQSAFSVPPCKDIFDWTQEHFLHICLNLHNYFILFRDSYYTAAFLNSLSLSSISTIICLILGYMMAYALYQLTERKRTFVLILISLSFWTSFLIRVYSWMNMLSTQGFLNSLLLKIGLIDAPIHFLGSYYTVCLGNVFCYLPFMIFPIYSVMERIDRACIEASSDLGAHPLKTFWIITVPLTKYGIIAGCILVFTTTLGEFIIPELLGGPNAVTVGRVLWIEFFSNIDWPMACALSIVLAVFIICPVFLLQKRTNLNA